MPIGVVRFGGKSFKNENHLRFFVDELKNSTQDKVVVVSAIPNIFNILNEGLLGLVSHSSEYQSIIHKIENELKVLGTEVDAISVQKEINQLEGLLNGIQLTGDYSNALRDAVISFSEKIAVRVLAVHLKQNAIDATVIYPEELNLFVTEEFGNASVLVEENKALKEFQFSGISLVPGSFGVSINRKIVRLGNHASDYSAASLTKLLGAESLELWEPGQSFRSADTSIIPTSELISRLTYAEASELSYFTRSSLHPRIVEPLIEQHIPIHIYRFTEEGKKLETIINSETYISENVVKSVVSDDEIAILKLNGPGVGFKPGILAKVTSEFHHAGINIRSVITSQVSINIILEAGDAVNARKICSGLSLSSVSEISIVENITLIAVVGHGMQTHHGVSARLFTAVADQKINVILSGSGASDLASYLIVDQENKEKAIREIHKVFF